MIQEIIAKVLIILKDAVQGMGKAELINYIFWQNIRSSFLGMLLGIFMGIFSIIGIMVNGYIIGFVVNDVVSKGSIMEIWKLLPHGIFEIPAVLISYGLGLRLGMFIFAKEKLITFKEYLKQSITVFVFIVVPLLIIAAVIEGSLISYFGIA